MDFPVHTFVPLGEPFVSLILHSPHKMHDGSIFARDSTGVYQAVQCGHVKKTEFTDPGWERQLAHYDAAYVARLRADHATAQQFVQPGCKHIVATCPLLGLDPIDWTITQTGRTQRAKGFILLLHAAPTTTSKDGRRTYFSIALDFELIAPTV